MKELLTKSIEDAMLILMRLIEEMELLTMFAGPWVTNLRSSILLIKFQMDANGPQFPMLKLKDLMLSISLNNGQ